MELKDRERPRASQRPAFRALAWVPACAVVLSLFSAAPAQAAPTQAASAGTLSAPASAVTPSAFASQLESRYIDPDRVYSTDVRWWLGEASHTDETLLEEIQKLYDGGYRGVELAMQGDNVAPDATYGYGSPMWSHKWNLMMNKLLDLGMGVYLTSGTNWATSNVPDLDPDSQAAMQNLTLGTSAVPEGQSISVLPTPAASVQKAAAKFVTAYAYRIVEGDTLDPNSFIDLSSQVSQGATSWTQNLSWTAPSDGSYRVFAMWTQGTYQDSSPSVDKSYTTNYFDTRGVEALKEFWQDHYLSDPALNEKIKNGDVQLFMDSLEIHPGGGSEWTARVATAPQFTFWAEDMKQQFQQRKGYDITPWLFLVKGVQSSSFDAYFDLDDTGNYRLADANQKREDIINDYLDVLTQLYQERMLQPLKEWLNSVGIKTRAQISYGKTLEISEPIMNVDYPEAENYNQYNQIDLFRLWTGGSKLQNKVLSSETGAEMPVYSATRQDDLEDAYIQYAAGMQRIVWHVWGAGFSYGSTQWPGHNPTSFRQLGSRQPTSADYDEFNAHLGRVQQLVQTGKARSDVGFLRQNWNNGMSKNAGIGNDNGVMNWTLAHQGISYRSTELQDHGYTYDYFSPDFLFADGVSFDENTKTIEKGGYKAVVLYQNWLDIAGAERVRDWAQKGLKVVILGNAASRTPFNDGKETELKAVIEELKSLPTVRTATVADSPADYFSRAPGGYDDDVMEKLQELGVQPYTGFAEENLQLLNQTRVDDEGNQYVYLYNFDDGSYHKNSLKESVRNSNTGKVAQTEIVKEGTFVPYRIDAWTGKVTEIAEYEWKDGKTVVPVSLDYNNVDLLAFEKTDGSRLHATSTDAASARSVDGGVAVRATTSGTVTTELSNGKTRRTDVTVPASYDIRNWNLTVSSWKPGATPGDLVRTETVEGVTTTNKLTSTQKTDITVGLDTLKTWDQIPKVGKNVSGTGRYEAKFSWDAASASGAYLDLGSLVESATVWINGQKVGGDVSTNTTKVKKDVGGVGKATIDDGRGNQVPLVGKPLYTGGISWTKPVADVSPYLVNGENSIVIEYASSLSNLQLSRGIGTVTPHYRNWWNLAVDYFPAGPQQAKIVPFQDVFYDASLLDVTVGASVKALGGKAYVAVSVTNADVAPVDIEVSSVYGGKSFVQVAPGKTVTVSLNTRASAIPAGEVSVTAKGTVNGTPVSEQKKAAFGAFSAGR